MARIIVEGFENLDISSQTQWDSESFVLNSGNQQAATGNFMAVSGNAIVNLEEVTNELFLSFRTKQIYTPNQKYIKFEITMSNSTGMSPASGIFQLYLGFAGADSNARYSLDYKLTSMSSIPLYSNTLFFPENHWEIRLKNNQNKSFLLQVMKNGETVFDSIVSSWDMSDEFINWFGPGTYFTKLCVVVGYIGMDDLIIDNAEWCGNSRVYCLVPTFSGDIDDWAPAVLGSPNAELVNSSNDNTHIESNTPNQKSFFNVTDLPTETLTIKNVKVISKSLTPGYPILEHIQTGLKTNDTEVYTDSKKLGNRYEIHEMDTYNTNPITGLAWTVNEVNNLQIGVKAKSS